MPKIKSLRKHRTEVHPYKLPENNTNVNDDNDNDVDIDQAIKHSSSNGGNISGNSDGSVVLSRGQRRRAAKNERVQIKLGNIPSPMMQTSTANKGKGKGKGKESSTSNTKLTQMLSELEESLRANADNSEDIKPAASVITSNKMKHQIAVRETARMKLIQKHPSFVQDPMAAMKAHLEQMVALRQSASSNAKSSDKKAK